jgi:hypothetical protein
MRNPQAIPTTYRGVNMRSRLEARWAHLFDQFGWNWYYEPIDLAGWIPDFVLDGHGYKPLLVDVKPFTDLERNGPLDIKIRRALDRDMEKYNVFVTRAYPHGDGYSAHVGWVSEYYPHDLGTGLDSFFWDDAVILRPHKTKGVFGLAACCQSYQDRITGFYDGDAGYNPLNKSEFMLHWHDALNATQWKRAA